MRFFIYQLPPEIADLLARLCVGGLIALPMLVVFLWAIGIHKPPKPKGK